MSEKLKPFFDGESWKVYLMGAAGVTTGLSANQLVSVIVGCLTALYIGIKIVKQLRDWNKPDGE